MFCILVVGFVFIISKATGALTGSAIPIPSIEEVNSIEDIVQPYLNHKNTKALSIGIFDKGQIQYYNYGICSEDHPVLPTQQSIYDIGSITKTFTTAVLAQMVQEGKVKLTDPISLYLPKEVFKWASDSLAITLEDLATHQSSLPRMPSNFPRNPFSSQKNYQQKDLFDDLATFSPKVKSKRKASYSNFGVGLLGSILAEIEELTYEEMVSNRILLPLGMKNTFIESDKEKMVGHNLFGRPAPPMNFQVMHGAGAIRSSTEDIMKYMIANLERKEPFQTTHHPRAIFNDPDKIGLGWILIPSKTTEGIIIFHNGGTSGFFSALAFNKDTQTGVIVLSNSFQSVDEVCFRILELLEKEEMK